MRTRTHIIMYARARAIKANEQSCWLRKLYLVYS